MPSRTNKSQLRPPMADRGKVIGSPKWKSATDVFKTPRSPSPLQKRTRRSSIYQRKPAKSDITKAKTIASPPGVKTRARRSSIYQKGGGRLLSPNSLPVRTRRTSMYVPSTRNLKAINEFSKVWATPVKGDVKVTLSPVEKKISINPILQVESTVNKSAKKSVKKEKNKTPVSVKKVAKKSSYTTDESPKSAISLSEQVMLKRSTRQNPIAEHDTIATVKPLNPKSNTPKTLIKTPRSVKKTPKESNNTKLALLEQVTIKESTRHSSQESDKKSKTPENKQKTPENKPKSENKPKTLPLKKSVTKSSKRQPLSTHVTQEDEQLINLEPQKESTPKSLKVLRAKSFYGTPKSTLSNKPPEDLIQFSTGPSKSMNKRKRVSVVLTPASTPKKESIKKQYRKTPKPTKPNLDDSLYSTPVSTTKKARVAELDQKEQLVMKDNTNKPFMGKVRLSPEEMSSVLRSAEKEERERERRFSESLTKDGENSPTQTTPVIAQKGKRISSKKLSEVVDMNVSDSNVTGLSATSPNSSVELNDTIYTDSRSSRCIIL